MNSACQYGEERLAGLLYEDADEAEMIEMRAHLATCQGCRTEFEHLSSTKDLLSAWPNAVNAPRMVYVNRRSGVMAKVRRWAEGIAGPGLKVALRPAATAAAVVVVLVAFAALLDVRVAADGKVQIGFAASAPVTERSGVTTNDTAGDVAVEAADAITRQEFEEGLLQAVTYMEELLLARSEQDRRLLMATIDERMQEQGLAMNQQLRGIVDTAFTDLERQHENELGLVFSAIDELGAITGAELQRMNTILASLVQRGPGDEE